MEGRKMLFRLSDIAGVSGSEDNLHEILEEYFKEWTDETTRGRLGDFTAVKKGSGGGGPRILVEAHSDQIGFMVKSIDERGFVHFTGVTEIDPAILPAQEVVIHGRKDVYGVIGMKPPHVLTPEERKTAVRMEDMKIDVGMTQEEAKSLIKPGDTITAGGPCTDLLEGYITGRAMDNRTSLCAMYECARLLKGYGHTADVYFSAAPMEEIGCLGGGPAAYAADPDAAIVLDVTFADTYGYSELPGGCGDGVEIAVGPNVHPELTDELISIAEENCIPYFISVYPGHTGTDAYDIQVTREGIPTVLISIPIRYMHTFTEVVKYEDIERAARLTALFISSLKGWGDLS
jgi:endoglucanase